MGRVGIEWGRMCSWDNGALGISHELKLVTLGHNQARGGHPPRPLTIYSEYLLSVFCCYCSFPEKKYNFLGCTRIAYFRYVCFSVLLRLRFLYLFLCAVFYISHCPCATVVRYVSLVVCNANGVLQTVAKLHVHNYGTVQDNCSVRFWRLLHVVSRSTQFQH